MRKIYIIGTIHNMLPKHKEELESILKEINPDQLFIEMTSKDLKSKNFKKYSKEMICTYKWGKKNHRKINGFDSSIKIEKKSISLKLERETEQKLMKIIKKYDWKDLNKPNYKDYKEIDKLIIKLIDQKKNRLRNQEMVENIRKLIVKEGKVLILTGVGNLKFFKRKFKNITFPLRS